MNVVTTKWLVEDVTPKLGIKYLENLGITTMDEENDAYAPLGLGGISNGVTNLELTGCLRSHRQWWCLHTADPVQQDFGQGRQCTP